MTKSILTLLAFFLLLNLSAQTKYEIKIPGKGEYSGFIVQNNGDTLIGKISVPAKNSKIYREFKFKDQNGSEVLCTPNTIIKFEFDGLCFVTDTVRIINNLEPVFLQVLSKGIFNYYRYEYVEINATVSSGLPIVYPNTETLYYFQYSGLRISRVTSYRDIAIFFSDRPELENKILNGIEYDDLTEVVHDYNLWISESKNEFYKMEVDTIKQDLFTADKNNLLLKQHTDSSLLNYYCRLIKYANNTYDILTFAIYDHRYKNGNYETQGLKIYTQSGSMKIGEWKYYYKGDKNGNSKIKKHEFYNSWGNLDGAVLNYDINGNVLKSTQYKDGIKVKN